MRASRNDFEIVNRLSVLMTQFVGMPSRLPKEISLGITRIVLEISATVIDDFTMYARSRDTSTTGLRPDGKSSRAHQISPRLIDEIGAAFSMAVEVANPQPARADRVPTCPNAKSLARRSL